MRVWCTNMLRPEPPRIGRLGSVVLPRPVPIADLAVGTVGAIAGALIGTLAGWILPFLGKSTASVATAGIGAMAAVALRGRNPWRGESVARVAVIRIGNFWNTRKTICPGTGMGAMWADGDWVCPECFVVGQASGGVLVEHDWRRRVYLGTMEVRPDLQEREFVPGCVPADGSRW